MKFIDKRPFALPCGGLARFDHQSECSWRCETCFAVVGSVGMPRDCKQLLDEQRSPSKLQCATPAKGESKNG